MDDLAFLRERIESYADYTNDGNRYRSDDEVRAYVGEALAGLSARLHPAGAAGDALSNTLLRCEFADQAVVRALDADHFSAGEVAAMHAADRELVTLAERADAVDAAGLEAYLAQIDTAFDRRTQLLTSGSAAAWSASRQP